MSETPTSGDQPTIERKPRDLKQTTLLVVIVLVLVTIAWLLLSKAFAVRIAQEDGLKGAALSMAATSLPLLDLHSKNRLGDEETLQRVVDGIVQSRRFSFAAILDAQGRVVAASDRNTAKGRPYPDFKSGEVVELSRSGSFEVIQPIEQSNVVYGAVVLRRP